MSNNVRVRYDASVEGEVTEFDDDGVPTLIINPLPVTVETVGRWADSGLFDEILWEVDMNLQKQLEDLVGNRVGYSTNCAKSTTGEYYVTLTSGGIKPDGVVIENMWKDTLEEAERCFLAEFLKYQASVGEGARLHWRQVPRLETHSDTKRYIIWSRLLLTHKWGPEEAHDATVGW